MKEGFIMHVDGGWFPSNPSFVVVSSRLVSCRGSVALRSSHSSSFS